MFFIAIFVFITFATAVAPTTVEQFSLTSLTEKAVKIVWGHCEKITPILVNDEPYTTYEFTVIETIKGSHTPKIKLSLPGGSYQGKSYQIVGMPIFQTNTHELLFLTQSSPNKSAWPIGLYQGSARIIRAKNGLDRVFFRHKPLVTKNLTAKQSSTTSQNHVDNGETLNHMLNKIRRIISEQSNEH